MVADSDAFALMTAAGAIHKTGKRQGSQGFLIFGFF
jgi:hypothetical protein